MTRAVLDLVARGARSRDDVAQDFTAALGGREVARFAIPSWAGLQLAFAGGIRLEVLEPVANPADDFLDRFLQRSGVSPHHATFKVEDIEAAISHLRRVGIEPVKVDLSNPGWREAFLHPASGLGPVVQLAQQGGKWAAEFDPGEPPAGAVAAEFLGAELASDPQTARTVFGEVLGGRAQPVGDAVAYSWDGGGSLLVKPVAAGERPRVLALVFRAAAGGGEQPGEHRASLYAGPAALVTLAAGEPWPL
ncbi:MAG: hypothetical protein NVSMB17_08140 [Candidatus Dormibacteria bacterium]